MKMGADPNIFNNKGETALHLCSENEQIFALLSPKAKERVLQQVRENDIVLEENSTAQHSHFGADQQYVELNDYTHNKSNSRKASVIQEIEKACELLSSLSIEQLTEDQSRFLEDFYAARLSEIQSIRKKKDRQSVKSVFDIIEENWKKKQTNLFFLFQLSQP